MGQVATETMPRGGQIQSPGPMSQQHVENSPNHRLNSQGPVYTSDVSEPFHSAGFLFKSCLFRVLAIQHTC